MISENKSYFNYKKQLFFIVCNKILRLKNFYKYDSIPDSVISANNKNFINNNAFKDSYNFAVNFVGEDFRIPFRVHQAIWAVSNSLSIEGDIVELGTGRGFIISSVLNYFQNSERFNDKNIILFDIFLKPSISGLGILNHEQYYANSYQSMKSKFDNYKNVKLIEGDIYNTLNNNIPKKIAFLHIDLNNADVELFSIKLLWNNLQKGAIILLDDYANAGHDEQFLEWNIFAESQNRIILTTPSGQGILIK